VDTITPETPAPEDMPDHADMLRLADPPEGADEVPWFDWPSSKLSTWPILTAPPSYWRVLGTRPQAGRRVDVASEVQALVARSGMSEAGRRGADRNLAARLSIYMSGKVVPSATHSCSVPVRVWRMSIHGSQAASDVRSLRLADSILVATLASWTKHTAEVLPDERSRPVL
jgi:hypothetical protein